MSLTLDPVNPMAHGCSGLGRSAAMHARYQAMHVSRCAVAEGAVGLGIACWLGGPR